MLILNFAHPLTPEQQQQIEQFTGASIEEVRNIPVHIDQEQELGPQVVELVNAVGLTQEEWQSRVLLINPPGYAPVALVLFAELHGRRGHFPAVIRVRPKPGAVPTFEIAEILNLQEIRNQARQRRYV
jgi:hypothetical protein